MPAFTAGLTVLELVPANADRVEVIVHNSQSGTVVRVDKDRELAAASANIMYYQDSIIFRGPIARQRLWVISDTATTTVNYTEVV